MKNKIVFSPRELDRIIEMAWEDRTSFDVIKKQFGIAEKDVIKQIKLYYWRLNIDLSQ